jgi:hypothetical protein
VHCQEPYVVQEEAESGDQTETWDQVVAGWDDHQVLLLYEGAYLGGNLLEVDQPVGRDAWLVAG